MDFLNLDCMAAMTVSKWPTLKHDVLYILCWYCHKLLLFVFNTPFMNTRNPFLNLVCLFEKKGMSYMRFIPSLDSVFMFRGYAWLKMYCAKNNSCMLMYFTVSDREMVGLSPHMCFLSFW